MSNRSKIKREHLVKSTPTSRGTLKRKSQNESSDSDDDDVIFVDSPNKPKKARRENTSVKKEKVQKKSSRQELSGQSDSDDEVIILDDIPLKKIKKEEVKSENLRNTINKSSTNLKKITTKKRVSTQLIKKENVKKTTKQLNKNQSKRITSTKSKSKAATVTKKFTQAKTENCMETNLPIQDSVNAAPQMGTSRKPLVDINDWKPSQACENAADDIKPRWSDSELLAEKANIEPVVATNLAHLFENGNTIPFIARYRKDVTGNMTPERLRETKEYFDELCNLKIKMKTVIKNIEKIGELRQELRDSILSTRTAEELEHIYAPFKPGGKRTLAEKAKELGLEDAAMTLVKGSAPVNLNSLIDLKKKELSTLPLVEKGIMHIIASVIGTDTEMLTFLRDLRKQCNFQLQTKKLKPRSEDTKHDVKGAPQESKYQLYFDFSAHIANIKPHQILAINRGESQKILSVKICVPEYVHHKFKDFCFKKWIKSAPFDPNRKRIIDGAIEDSYNRLVQPLMIREIRAELKQKAEKASTEVFSTNLKHLLLVPPLKGKTILAIDPGFSKGCKVALVSTTNSLLDYGVIFPHTSKVKGDEFLRMLLLKHNCELIAIGNGTACRETEQWLSDLIQDNYFAPLNVTYTIVNESGASIYSCGPEAKKEFPDLDPNIISSVSLARRVQEPLAELVKVEPQHLGVGMYQHDLKKKHLEESLSDVVSECVSFVGVDLNTTSQCLLRRIAGLTDKRATEIISYREKNGAFTHRKQLLDVKGIGPRVFQQSSGFLRVGPTDLKEAVDFYRKPNTTKLDRTYIHPESYDIARKILKRLKLEENDIGEASFIHKVNAQKSTLNLQEMSDAFDCTEGTVRLVLDSLTMPLNHDLRSECKVPPLFKKGVTSFDDLSVGTVLTGSVANVTHFGCFVDIGVGTDGLIHVSRMNRLELQIGNRVEVQVDNIDFHRRRIGLRAIRLLN